MTNRIPPALALITFTALSGASLVPAPAAAQGPCPAQASLTGTWRGNDQGIYHIRQVGNVVWWVGIDSTSNGAGWTHAFRGFRNGDMVTGSWADVRGVMGSGTLTFRQRNGNYLNRTGTSGSGFGGIRLWRQGCPLLLPRPI